MQMIDYRRDQVVQIEGAPGYQVLIALAPDERIENVALGDSSAWQAVASQSGNLLFVRPTQDGVSTNMTVITSARFYAFDLVPANGAPPYEVRFRYPAEPDGNIFARGDRRPRRLAFIVSVVRVRCGRFACTTMASEPISTGRRTSRSPQSSLSTISAESGSPTAICAAAFT